MSSYDWVIKEREKIWKIEMNSNLYLLIEQPYNGGITSSYIGNRLGI